jgi:hypothetical protein
LRSIVFRTLGRNLTASVVEARAYSRIALFTSLFARMSASRSRLSTGFIE